MRNTFSIGFIAVLIFFAFISTHAQSSRTVQDRPTIEVTSKAEIAVEPDSATISVDFTKVNKDLDAARRSNEESVAKMIAIAKKHGIVDANIWTRNISVAMKYISIRDRQKPVYDQDGDEIGTREFVGYEVSRSVTIKLAKLSEFDTVFNDILSAEPTEIEKVEFESSKLIELRQQAREMAMKAVRQKAVAMTAAIGQTIGKAIRISEGTASDRYSQYSNSNVTNFRSTPAVTTVSSNLGTFSAGSINVEATVTVIFLLN